MITGYLYQYKKLCKGIWCISKVFQKDIENGIFYNHN